jgi:hypothetical protein
VLHLLNGDATAAVFPSTLPGEREIWRDIMVEGPAVDDGVARAVWLAPRLGVTPDEYAAAWRAGRAALARAESHDEIVLWFEQDLFCAVNLWFVLARLPASASVSLVFPPLTTTFAGLGTLTPAELTPLFERRAAVDQSMREQAAALWRAYAADDPTMLTRTDSALPFAREAVHLHSGRFPSTSDGLDDIERGSLHELASGPRAFAALFRAVMHSAALRAHGMGDVQYAMALRDLDPLLTIDAAAAPFAHWRLSLAAPGADVLAGRRDALALRSLDRWLGGVHLRPGAPLWRWNGARLVPD